MNLNCKGNSMELFVKKEANYLHMNLVIQYVSPASVQSK